MDRQHRRDLKHDKFVDEVGSLTAKARENQRLLLTITVALVGIAVVAYGVYFYRSTRENKAQSALSAAIETIDSPLIQPGTPNPAARFKTEDERNAKADALFRALQKTYSGTNASDVASIYLARLAAARNDVATSKKLLQDFIAGHPKHLLVGAVRYSLYDLRIGSGEAPQVASELNQELAKTKDQALPPDALLVLLAKSYEAQGNGQQAKDTYRRLVTQFPDSGYAIEAQRKVGAAT